MDPRQVLQRYRLRPKKQWGQNFLRDQDIVHQMVELLGVTPDDRVVELGAGTGVLTRQLLECASRLFAVERDRDLVHLLGQEFASSDLDIIEADAAQLSLEELPGEGPLLVIGNLPYNVSSPILFHLLNKRHLFRRALLMVQQEVAERLLAQPGDGKAYSILSIRFGAFFELHQALFVSRECFYPRPKVDSVVVQLEPLPAPRVPIDDERWFSRTVKAAFARRRKTLQNNLSHAFPLERPQLLNLLADLKIDPRRRGETLTLLEFSRLAQGLQQAMKAATP